MRGSDDVGSILGERLLPAVPSLGAGTRAAAWRLAFEELYGIPADIGEFTDTGMTDPDVGHRTFAAVLGREPSRAELNR